MWAKILLLLFTLSFLYKTDHSFDQDLGRHLKLGEIIWQTKVIPSSNLFSYTNPDFPFINTHWLFEVWAYLASQTLGLDSLLILKIIIILASVWLTLKTIPQKHYALLIPIGFLFLHVLRERTELRPEIFSFFFTALSYFILEKFLQAEQKPYTKLIFLLPFIQLIWINTHIYFFVGLLLQAVNLLSLLYLYIKSRLQLKKLKIIFLVFITSCLFSLINPNNVAGLLYPLNVNKNYGYTIVENQTILFLESINFKNPNFIFVKISIGLIICSLIVAFLKKNLQPKNLLLAISAISLALLNVRSIPYIFFLGFSPAIYNFGLTKNRLVLKILSVFFIFLLLLQSYYYLNGDYYRKTDSSNLVGLKLKQNVKNAMDFVISNNLPSPIYNNFDIGSYIIYRGYPKYKVFVDGRPEGYPDYFFTQTYIPSQSDYSKFQNLQSKYGFKTIIFSHTDQTPWGKSFLTSVVKDTNWKVVFIDNFMVVLVKNDENTLPAINLAELDPSFYSFDTPFSYLNLSLFLLQTENVKAALKFAQKTLQQNPQSPLGNALFGINKNNNIFW